MTSLWLRPLSAFFFLLSSLSLAGCGKSVGSTNGDAATGANSKPIRSPLQVVCTTGQVADLVQNIGGKYVKIVTLMGPSVDPHQFKANMEDQRAMSAADVVFYNGLHLEGRLTDALEGMAKRQRVYAVSEGIVKNSKDRLRTPAEFEGAPDPHVWFDVQLWTLCAGEVSDRLSEVDPAHKDDYRRLSAAYVARLRQLDQDCRDQLATIPKAQRVLVTAHDAFGYFGKAYDVEVHGLQGISTADEADVASINKLIKMLVARKIKAVFVESSVPPQAVQNLITECARQGHEVKLGGELFSDAMGNDGTPEANYVGMVEHNLKTIVGALK